MIVYGAVFQIRDRNKIADYALPFKKNTDLDYELIADKCQKITEGIIEFDNNVHQMDSKETKGLFYFFKYVKKNLFLIAALDQQFAFYEDELKE